MLWHLPAEVRNNKLVRSESKVLSSNSILVGKVLMYFKTFPISDGRVYFGYGRFLLKTPVTKLHTLKCTVLQAFLLLNYGKLKLVTYGN